MKASLSPSLSTPLRSEVFEVTSSNKELVVSKATYNQIKYWKHWPIIFSLSSDLCQILWSGIVQQRAGHWMSRTQTQKNIQRVSTKLSSTELSTCRLDFIPCYGQPISKTCFWVGHKHRVTPSLYIPSDLSETFEVAIVSKDLGDFLMTLF